VLMIWLILRVDWSLYVFVCAISVLLLNAYAG